jgi:hypothetical protein
VKVMKDSKKVKLSMSKSLKFVSVFLSTFKFFFCTFRIWIWPHKLYFSSLPLSIIHILFCVFSGKKNSSSFGLRNSWIYPLQKIQWRVETLGYWKSNRRNQKQNCWSVSAYREHSLITPSIEKSFVICAQFKFFVLFSFRNDNSSSNRRNWYKKLSMFSHLSVLYLTHSVSILT